MNLLLKGDYLQEDHFYVSFVYNHYKNEVFFEFVQSLFEHKTFVEELCTAEYDESDGNPKYIFDTCEGETIPISYEDMLYYLKIALQRYIECYANNDEKKSAEELLKKCTSMMQENRTIE